MKTILLISPYWKEPHRWMVSSVKLAELWQKLGYRVVVACMGSTSSPQVSSASGVERVSNTLTLYRKKDFFLPDPLNFGIAPGFTGLVRRIISEEKPDLIVVNKVLFWTSFSLLALRLTGHRVLLLTDAFVGMTWWPRTLLPKIIMGIGAWTIGWLVLLFADRIVTYFPQNPHFLRRIGIAGKTQVIPTGIDAEEWRRGADTARPVTITYTGRLESVKGVDDFLAAAVENKKNYPEMRIRVVGWYKPGHSLVSEYRDQVEFLGLRDDIKPLLSETDIFVLPSYSEGLSNSLMEAMSMGCACIASDIGGNRFLVQNGVSGFLFPPGDRAALASHIRRLVEDPAKRRAIASAARERIEKEFDWRVVGRRYEELFTSLLA
jgi:glycosyltransferase involved in cell wall biosynthesis